MDGAQRFARHPSVKGCSPLGSGLWGSDCIVGVLRRSLDNQVREAGCLSLGMLPRCRRLAALLRPVAHAQPEVVFERVREQASRLLLPALFLPMQEYHERQHEASGQPQQPPSQRSCEPIDDRPEQIASQAIPRGPHHGSQGVAEEKARPAHVKDPCQHSSPHAQHRDKASEEDDFAPMPLKQGKTQLQLALRAVNAPGVAQQETRSGSGANPVPEIVPQDRSAGCRHNDPANGQLVRGSRRNGRDEQHGFARKGNAGTLKQDKEQHRPIAIGGKPQCQGTWKHGAPSSFFRRPRPARLPGHGTRLLPLALQVLANTCAKPRGSSRVLYQINMK